LIQETEDQAIAVAEAAARRGSQSANMVECPPSPDDIIFLEKQRTRMVSDPQAFTLEGSVPLQSGPSASTISSSLDGYGTSVSQNMSVPSFGIVSTASSPPGDTFLGSEIPGHMHVPKSAMEAEPEFMRTADTITKHGRPRQVATGAALEDWGDQGYDDSDDDSDEEGIVMGPSSKKR
jgi:hypothetical protein